MSGDALLEVEGLEKHYPITRGLLQREVGRVRAVDGIDLAVGRGETVGLIGESGCGKSTAALSLLRLEEPTAGTVRFDGTDLTTLGDADLRELRRRVQMVFQDPTESFDPRMTIGESVAEPLRIHGLDDRARRREIVEDLLVRVGLDASVREEYPHELSGGQKQRAAIARALVLDPDLLVLDEPVSALDVSVQAEILALLDDLQTQFDLSVLLITHDMGVVRELCDRVAVMYLGEIVERGPTEDLFTAPQHPYTRALVSAIPRPDPSAPDRDVTLTGDVPDAEDPPSGCRFHTRCPSVIPPQDHEFAADEYRRVMDLRRWLVEDEADRDDLADLAVAAGVVEDAGAADADAKRTAVRDEFDIPETLSDPDAEAELAAAVDALVAGDDDGAAERLREAFESVCERAVPPLQATGAGHEAACHLHDDGKPGSPDAAAEPNAADD